MAMLPNLGMNSMNPARMARQQARMQTQQMVPQRQQAMSQALLGSGQQQQQGMLGSMGAQPQPWNSVFGPPPQQQQAQPYWNASPGAQLGGTYSQMPQNSALGGFGTMPNMATTAPQPTPGLGSTRSGGGLLR